MALIRWDQTAELFVCLAATLATRLRLTPSSKLDKRTPADGELPVA
jgi:hypothetical protein